MLKHMKTSARFGQKLLELIVFGLLYHSILRCSSPSAWRESKSISFHQTAESCALQAVCSLRLWAFICFTSPFHNIAIRTFSCTMIRKNFIERRFQNKPRRNKRLRHSSQSIYRKIIYRSNLLQCKWFTTTYHSHSSQCKWFTMIYLSNLLQCNCFSNNYRSNLLQCNRFANNYRSNLSQGKWFTTAYQNNLLQCKWFSIIYRSNLLQDKCFANTYRSNLL